MQIRTHMCCEKVKDQVYHPKHELEVEKWKYGEWYNGSMRDARSSGFVRAGARVR